MIDKLWRWEIERGGWLYRLEMIPRASTPQAEFPWYSKQLDSDVAMQDPSVIHSIGSGSLGWKSFALSMPESGTIKVKLLYSKLSTAQQQIIASPEKILNTGAGEGNVSYRVCNVWRVVSDCGSYKATGTATWKTLYEGAQKRGSVNKYVSKANGDTWLEIELHDILRTILESYDVSEYRSAFSDGALVYRNSSQYFVPQDASGTRFFQWDVNTIECSVSDFYKICVPPNPIANPGFLYMVFMRRNAIANQLRRGLQLRYRQLLRNNSATVTLNENDLFQAIRYFACTTGSTNFAGERVAETRVGAELGINDVLYMALISTQAVTVGSATNIPLDSVVGGLNMQSKAESMLTESTSAFELLRSIAEAELVKVTHKNTYAAHPSAPTLAVRFSLLHGSIEQSVRTLSYADCIDRELEHNQGEGSINAAETNMTDLFTDDVSSQKVDVTGSTAQEGYAIQLTMHNAQTLSEKRNNATYNSDNRNYVTLNPYVRGLYYASSPYVRKVHERCKVKLSTTEEYVIGSDLPVTGADTANADAFRGWIIEQQKLSGNAYAISKVLADNYGSQNQVFIPLKLRFNPSVIMPDSLGELYTLPVPPGMNHEATAVLVKIANVDYLSRTMECTFFARGIN